MLHLSHPPTKASVKQAPKPAELRICERLREQFRVSLLSITHCDMSGVYPQDSIQLGAGMHNYLVEDLMMYREPEL